MCAAAADRRTNVFQKCVPQPLTDVRFCPKMCAAAADRRTNFFQKCVPQPLTDIRFVSKNVPQPPTDVRIPNFQKIEKSNFSKILKNENFKFC